MIKYIIVLFLLISMLSCGDKYTETWYINPVTNICKKMEYVDYNRFMMYYWKECKFIYYDDYEDYYHVCKFHGLDWYFYKSEEECL